MIRDFNRYIVVKNSHAKQALTKEEHEQLYRLAMKTALWRRSTGKDPFECLVVEGDWPEYEKVWKMIEDRVDDRWTFEKVKRKFREDSVGGFFLRLGAIAVGFTAAWVIGGVFFH